MGERGGKSYNLEAAAAHARRKAGLLEPLPPPVSSGARVAAR
jgi:hypothetical protein